MELGQRILIFGLLFTVYFGTLYTVHVLINKYLQQEALEKTERLLIDQLQASTQPVKGSTNI